ncbi:substrate-binding periplasmic protein [Maricurvus nonylphenolicus]|uniref:substrate-binding periplasmic protein n=1 Tax=Maricurvus nonylphenolicus TaxID=1008307 RepID=UPI0036F3E85D
MDYPPYYYKRGEVDHGTAVDALNAILTPLGYSYRIEVMPIERLYTEAGSGYGDLTMVHTYPGLTLEDYPDFLLVCPTPMSRIPIRYYTYQLELTELSRKALSKLRIGLFRYASFQRGLTQREQMGNISRFNDVRYMFRALLADRIDLAINGPYSMRVMAEQHGSYFPYELNIDLGNIESFVAVTQRAEKELGIYQALCQQAANWSIERDFKHALGKHMKSYLKSLSE